MPLIEKPFSIICGEQHMLAINENWVPDTIMIDRATHARRTTRKSVKAKKERLKMGMEQTWITKMKRLNPESQRANGMKSTKKTWPVSETHIQRQRQNKTENRSHCTQFCRGTKRRTRLMEKHRCAPTTRFRKPRMQWWHRRSSHSGTDHNAKEALGKSGSSQKGALTRTKLKVREHAVKRMVGRTNKNGIAPDIVQWYSYTSKHDTVEPPEHLLGHFIWRCWSCIGKPAKVATAKAQYHFKYLK